MSKTLQNHITTKVDMSLRNCISYYDKDSDSDCNYDSDSDSDSDYISTLFYKKSQKQEEPPQYSKLLISNKCLQLYGNIIHVPSECIFWGNYDTSYPVVTTNPTYYSCNISPLSNIQHKSGCFTNKKELKLIDVHFMKVILKELLDNIKLKKEFNFENNIEYDENEEKCISHIVASFGICSLFHQINLIKKINPDADTVSGLNELEKYYNKLKYNTIEQNGIRISEKDIDGITMNFLKYFFKGFADGFISQNIINPFHDEKNNGITTEIIIFNPLKKGITLLEETPITEPNDDVHMNYLFSFKMQMKYVGLNSYLLGIYTNKINDESSNNINTYIHPIDEFNLQIAKNDNSAIELSKIGKTYGKLWRDEYFFVFKSIPPHPRYKVRKNFKINPGDIELRPLNDDYILNAGSIIRRPLTDNK
jgi:hypothetical protein